MGGGRSLCPLPSQKNSMLAQLRQHKELKIPRLTTLPMLSLLCDPVTGCISISSKQLETGRLKTAGFWVRRGCIQKLCLLPPAPHSSSTAPPTCLLHSLGTKEISHFASQSLFYLFYVIKIKTLSKPSHFYVLLKSIITEVQGSFTQVQKDIRSFCICACSSKEFLPPCRHGFLTSYKFFILLTISPTVNSIQHSRNHKFAF